MYFFSKWYAATAVQSTTPNVIEVSLKHLSPFSSVKGVRYLKYILKDLYYIILFFDFEQIWICYLAINHYLQC